MKAPVGQGGALIPTPTVSWPASRSARDRHRRHVSVHRPARDCGPAADEAHRSRRRREVQQLTFNPGGIYTEVAWTFSGGGYSHVFAKPSYQNILPAGSTFDRHDARRPRCRVPGERGNRRTRLPVAAAGRRRLEHRRRLDRLVLDRRHVALGCPQWAGLVAIADQINGGGLGLLNPALYKIGADPARYAADFFDVATNNTNQGDPSVPGYPSTQGWDAVTGLGTPNAAVLVPDLVQAAHGH